MKACPRCASDFWDEVETCPIDGAALASKRGELPPEVGEVLGSYRLISLLGTGGMGRIYVGAHIRLKRFVAIKRLRPELQRKPASIARFFREARTVNGIRHPHIIEVIDLVDDRGGAYCVLELLSGPSVRTRLERQGPLSLESAVRVAAQIADALGAVHELGVVHRDIKPDNIILIERGGRDDYVKLIDFGVATMTDDESGGGPAGTPAYASPEHGAGERVDGRADIYSLGVVLYEMVTGAHPFPSETASEYLLRHADDPPPPLPDRLPGGQRKPPELERVIRRCLAKDPEQRFASAASLALALRGIDLAPPRRRRRPLVLAGALVLSAGGAGLFAYKNGLYQDLWRRYLEAGARSAPAVAGSPAAGAPATDAAPAKARPSHAGAVGFDTPQDPLNELGFAVSGARADAAADAPGDAAAPPPREAAREKERDQRLRRERARRLRRERRLRRREQRAQRQEQKESEGAREEPGDAREERRSMREGVIDPFNQ